MKWILTTAFIIVTSLFIMQHASEYSWDFHAYTLNGEYLLHDGSYFEPLRPPLMPTLIGLFEYLLPRTIAEYAFIILASTLFLYASIKLADSLGMNRTLLYLLSSQTYVLATGLTNGTELLAYSFTSLFLSSILANKTSGVFIGLAGLSRYANLSLAPLMLFQPKKIVKNALVFGLTLLPWLAYNYFTYGNIFLSIADQYANNIYFREYLHTPIKLFDFLLVGNIIWPIALIGLWDFRKNTKRNTILAIIAILTIVSYINTPLKSARYLFMLTLPLAIWAYEGLRVLPRLMSKQTLAISIFTLFTISIIGTAHSMETPGTRHIYEDALAQLDDHANCSIMSNAWVELNYLGRPTQDFPRKELVEKRISEGQIIIMFNQVGEPAYARDADFLSTFPQIARTRTYTIIGTGCAPITANDKPYMTKLANTIEEIHGYRTEDRPCRILFGRYGKLCERIHGPVHDLV